MHPALLFAGFFLFAVASNLLGPLATNIMASTGMNLSDSGILVSFQQIGSLFSVVASLTLMKRFRQTSVMRIGYVFLIAAFLLIALTTSTGMLFALYLVLGFGTFLIDSGSNATLASEYYAKRTTYVPLLHFCYSAGAIATGYFVLPFKGSQWRWAYAIVGMATAVILVAGLADRKMRTKRAENGSSQKEATRETSVQTPPVHPLLKDKPFILYTLVIMLYMGSQIICSAWIPVYVETELLQSPAITAASLTVFWVGIAISRLIIGPIMNRGGNPCTLSILGMTLAGVALIGATATSNITLVLICVALCGFFAGSTIPMYIVVTSTWYPGNTAFISLFYIVSGTIGRMIFPWLVTRIASATSLGFSLMLSSSLLFLSAILIAIVQSATRERSSY